MPFAFSFNKTETGSSSDLITQRAHHQTCYYEQQRVKEVEEITKRKHNEKEKDFRNIELDFTVFLDLRRFILLFKPLKERI